MLQSVIAISLGASIGAVLRWLLGVWLNGLFTPLPLGTLAANLIGGYFIGVAAGLFLQHPEVPPHWRLFVITGLLGGLTTFSTFSAEVVAALQQGRLGWAGGTIAAHLAGSVVMTLAGLATVGGFRHGT
jgi:CrcB protein